jgi:hypothetical protein
MTVVDQVVVVVVEMWWCESCGKFEFPFVISIV